MATPHFFGFDASYMQTAGYLERADLKIGEYDGLDYPDYYSAVAPSQAISTYGGVDVFAVTMLAGQTYKLDIDGASIPLEFDIINAAGKRVGGAADFQSFTASQTGTYYIAVHHASNDYTGEFDWERDTASTGSYRFNFSAPTTSIPGRSYSYSDAAQSYRFSDVSEEVRSNGGNDYLELMGGNDIGLGGTGNDTMFGGIGSDELSGEAGYDRLFGDSGEDVLRGGSEDDTLYGGSERDNLSGGTGNDTMWGGTGNDTLWGDSGNDVLRGDSGADFIRGGAGVDVMYGGADADTFHFLRSEAQASSSYTPAYHDRIEDFDYRQNDKIDLSDLSVYALGWRGSNGFTASNQVRVVALSNGYHEVQVNLDSDSASELDIMVKAVAPGGLIQSDFLL
jgi:Ca2+-binding RTX toxin-like protein